MRTWELCSERDVWPSPPGVRGGLQGEAPGPDRLLRSPDSLTRAARARKPGLRFTDKDEHMYFWFPLLAGLSELTFDPRADVRCHPPPGAGCTDCACSPCATRATERGVETPGSAFDRDGTRRFRQHPAVKLFATPPHLCHQCG